MSVWQHIEKSPEYQGLDDNGKAKLRRDYFADFIVKDPDFGKLPDPEREKVYLEFVNQGQAPLANIPDTPISDFVAAQDRLAGQIPQAVDQMAPMEPGMDITAPPIQQTRPLLPAHGQPIVTPEVAPPVPYPETLQPAHEPPGMLDRLAMAIPKTMMPPMEPELGSPYEPQPDEDLLRDLIKIIGAIPGGLGYIAGATEIGPQTKGMTLEQRSQRGQEMAARASEPFAKAERFIAPKREPTTEESIQIQKEKIANALYKGDFVPEKVLQAFPELVSEITRKRGQNEAWRKDLPTGFPEGYDEKRGGIIEPTGVDVAFDLLMKAGDSAGAKVLKETNNPYLAAAAATSIQAAPILLPLIGRRMPGLFRRVKASTPYRQMAIKERGLVLQTLEETMAKNPDITEGQLARMYPQYFEEAKAKRVAPERPITEEPAQPIPEAQKPSEQPAMEPQAPITAAPEPEAVKPSQFYIDKNNLQGSLEKLKTLRQRYAQFGQEDQIPKLDQAIKSIEEVIAAKPTAPTPPTAQPEAPAPLQAPKPVVPPEAAAHGPAQVTPFPEPRAELPATSQKQYFTLKKAQYLYQKDFTKLSDSQIQKDYVKLRDYLRFIESHDNYSRQKLIEGGYFRQVSDPSATGLVPMDPWLHTNLKTALDEITKERNKRKKITEQIEKPQAPVYEYFTTKSGFYVTVDKGPTGNYAFYTKKKLGDRGNRIRTRRETRVWYETYEEGLDALQEYAKKRGLKPAPLAGRVAKKAPVGEVPKEKPAEPAAPKETPAEPAKELPENITIEKTATGYKVMDGGAYAGISGKSMAETVAKARQEYLGEAEPAAPADLSKTFEENESSLAKVTNKYLKENLDPNIEQRLDEGVGNYHNKVVYQLKDGNFYYFSDLKKAKGARVEQKLIRIDKSEIEPLAEEPTIQTGAAAAGERAKKKIAKSKEVEVGQGEPALKPKEQKKWLLSEIGKAIKEAPNEGETVGWITFHVPGDGDFSIVNNKQTLKEFQKAAKSQFPEKIQKPIISYGGSRVGRPAPTRPSQTRLSGEGVEYYNEFQPRRRTALIEPTESDRFYIDGFYSEGHYAVKTPKSAIKKELMNQYAEPPSMEPLLENAKEAEPAVIVGEYKTEYEPEPFVHAMTIDENTHAHFNPDYIDNILTLHPDARPFMATSEGGAALFFKSGDEIVGLVMSRKTEGQGLEDVIPGQLRTRYHKVKPTSEERKAAHMASVGTFAKTEMKGVKVEGPEAYGEPPPSGENVKWSGKEIRPLEVPELTRLAKELMSGKYPQVWKRLRLGVLGDFRPLAGRERIRILAALGKDVEQLAKTVAHEIGHLIDFLPEGTLKRGNLLGRLASLKKFMKNTIAADPHGLPPLTAEDRLRIRKEAKEILLKENAGKLIDEVIRKEIPITPEDVLNIWNLVSADFPVDLHDYIKGLDTAGKKAVVKAALKGQVADELKKFAKTIEEKTGKKIQYKPSEKEIAERYKKLIEAELRKRQSYTASEIRNELTDFTQRWKPFNPSVNLRFTRYRLSGVELYADFLSAILTDPAFAFKHAPKSWDLWHNYMENKPQVKALYEQIQAELRSGDVDAKAEQALREGFAKKEAEWAEELKQDFQKLMAKDELGYLFVDTSFAVLRRVRKIGESNIPEHINPRYKLSDNQYFASELEGILTDFRHNIMRPIQKMGLDPTDLSSYLFHRRVSTERAEKINPEGWTADRSQKKLEEYNRNMPALKDFAAELDKIPKEWLYDDPAFDRMYNPALRKYIDENVGYAKFDIVGFLVKKIGPEATASMLGEAAVPGKIYRQVGTFRATGPPLTSTIIQVMRIKRAMTLNEAKRSIVSMYQHYPKELAGEFFPAKTRWNGKYLEIVPTHHPQLELMTWLDRGKLKGAYVPKFVAKAVQKNPIEAFMVTRIIRALSEPFKALFTQYNPGFYGTNLFRDWNKFVLALPGMNYPRAIYWYTKALAPSERRIYGIPDPVIKEMQKGNSLVSVANYRGDIPEDRMAERLLKRYHFQPKLWENKLTKPFQLFFHHLDNVGRGIETIPKVAGYMYLKKKFPDLPPEFLHYFIKIGPGSPAFMHRGAASGFYNSILLYSNAMKEGPRGLIQSLTVGGPKTQQILSTKRRKAEFAYKMVKYHIIPKIAMLLALGGFFGEGIRRIMQGVSDHDMTNYHIIPIGETKSGRSVYLRIPQDEFGRLMGGITYKVMSNKIADSKVSFGMEMLDYLGGEIPSLTPLVGAMWDVGAYMTGHAPYDFYRRREGYSDLVAEAGGTAEAKAFLKYMSNKMGGGIVHRFGTDNPHEIEKEIEKWIAIPGLSNIIGRWIKVSDYGKSEKIREEKLKPIRSEEAKKILRARDALTKMVQGKMDDVTDEERTALFEKFPNMQDQSIMKLFGRRYGTAVFNEFLTARSLKEKMAVWEWAKEHDQKLKAEGND